MNSAKYIPTTWLDGHEQFVESFLQDAEITFHDAGDIIYRQDEVPAGIFLVLRGIVEVSYTHTNGQTKIAAFIDRGTLAGVTQIGEYWPHHTLRCKTPVLLATQPPSAIQNWSGEMLLGLIKMQTRKMELALTQLRENAFCSVRGRMIQYLIERGRLEKAPFATELPVRFPFSKKECASIIGSTRERVGQIMKDLEEDRLVEVDKQGISFYLSKLEQALLETP